ncbi:MAG: class I SAM-dependent methyltransferase [Cyanobacteria bacterium P01_D01_bin.14]
MPETIPATSKLTDFWDSAAGQRAFGHPIPDRVIEAYFPSSGKVLDVGCGYGRLTQQLADSGFAVSGTDASQAMLDAAKDNAPACEFRRCTTTLPWEGHTFDVAILVTLLTSVPAEADQRELVGEVFRVLKPGGHVFVSDMPLQWAKRYQTRYAEGLKRYGEYGVFDLPNGGTVRHHQLAYFLDLMSGFEMLLLEPHAVTTMNGNSAQAFRYVGRSGK